MQDIRWQQRYSNYCRALTQLNSAIKLTEQRALSDLEQQGLIQSFEYTHELAWKTLKDFLEYQGQQDITGSRDAIKKSFQLGLIDQAEIWLDMITSRNQSSHTYNKATADKIVDDVVHRYIAQFNALESRLKQRLSPA